MSVENDSLIEQGLLSSSSDEWESARLRTEVISALAQLNSVSWNLADDAARKLNISRRQVYTLIARYRKGNGLVTDMLVKKPQGGKGKSRLLEKIEQIIQDVLRSHYLNKQKYSETFVWNEIARHCRKENLAVPAKNTVRLRIQLSFSEMFYFL